PDIDTSTSDWASQLVTVRRRNEGTPDLPFSHVLLTFGFDTAVSLTGIEMDLFNCPDWNVGTSSIFTVYHNPDYNLAATTNILLNLPFVVAYYNSSQSSCDSLSTATISESSFLIGSYRTVYILMDLSLTSSIQWVHVGEVRFLDRSGMPLKFSTLLSSSSTSRVENIIVTKTSYEKLSTMATSSAANIVPTSVPGDRENDSTCSEESSGSAVIAVSAVSLLLILTLTTVILTQCLLIIRMRRSRNKTETYAEATNPTTKTTDVPVSPNEAYALTKITSPREEVTYEVVQ
ncbi:hypothetical protein GBAR_LOCUS24784, partial [Geodia barretti]